MDCRSIPERTAAACCGTEREEFIVSEQPPPDQPNPAPKPGDSGTYHQELQHSPVSARVPEGVGRGLFSTGAIVMYGPHEFVIDFLLSMAPPNRVTARVVLPPSVVPLLLNALQDNLRKYEQNFGPPPRLPSPPAGATPPPISDVYEQLKLPDEMLSGTYANTVMIVHTPAEFCFDFITTFYPRSAVAARVYLSAPHVPQLLESLSRSYDQYRRKTQPNQPPPQGPGGPSLQ